MSRWRDDGLDKGEPTLFKPILCAKDEIRRDDDFVLSVFHVRSTWNRGFKAIVKGAGSMYTGDTFDGEGEEAYARALKQGEQLWDEEHARLDRLCEEHGLVRPKPEG